MPKGAESRTARNPRRREIPDGAKSQTATKAGRPDSGQRGQRFSNEFSIFTITTNRL
jgi:hypothetical protein